MSEKILTREEVNDIRERSAMNFSEDYITPLLNTIDHLYAQVDALMRVKEAADEFLKEVSNPAPDFGYRRTLRDRMSKTIATYSEAERENFK